MRTYKLDDPKRPSEPPIGEPPAEFTDDIPTKDDDDDDDEIVDDEDAEDA